MDKSLHGGEENSGTSKDSIEICVTNIYETDFDKTNTEGINKTKIAKSAKKYKSVIIRNLLISATLTTALVSWFTTAQGLGMYIFQGNLLFAGLISAAVQGLLYTLSISGVSLLHSKRIKGKRGRVALLALWFFLLLTSITFSYVYISKTAYPDTTMRSDAEMSLDLYVQGESEDLLSYNKRLEKYYSDQMSGYIRQFGSSAGGGFDIAEDDKSVFESEKDRLVRFYEDNKGSEIEAFYITDEIQRGIDKIKTGNYSVEDFNAYTASLEKKLQEISEKIKDYDSEYKEKRDEKIALDTRLETFENQEIWEYHKVLRDRDLAVERRDQCLVIKKELETFFAILKNCHTFATTEFAKGTESELHRKSVLLMGEMNKETINTDLIMSYAEDLYRIMIEENISADDSRLKGYATFRSNVQEYNNVISVRQDIEQELSVITDYSQSLILGIQNDSLDSIAPTSEATLDSKLARNENSDNKSKTEDSIEKTNLPIKDNKSMIAMSRSEIEHNEDMENGDTNDTISNKTHEAGTIQDKAWILFWSNRLSALQSEIKRLPSEVYADESTISFQIDKKAVLKRIADRKRLYLTELNDFDRAFSLLYETITGFHTYGTMIIVSIFFFFFLDLFSLSAGILLFFYRPSKDQREES